MKFSDLIHEIWKDKRIKDLKIKKPEIQIIIEVALEKITNGLIQYGKVKLKGLFTLSVRKSKGHMINDLKNKNGGLMKIDDYNKVAVESSQKLKEKLKEYKNTK